MPFLSYVSEINFSELLKTASIKLPYCAKGRQVTCLDALLEVGTAVLVNTRLLGCDAVSFFPED
jgi:hypothetical protein